MENNDKFEVVLLGIVYDPEKRKILIGKKAKDESIPKISWCFPGGRLLPGESIDKTLKSKIKEKTGYDVKNLGTIFSQRYPENPHMISIYFLCEIFDGEEKPGGSFVETKWVDPEEIENYFTTEFNTRLREYILNLR